MLTTTQREVSGTTFPNRSLLSPVPSALRFSLLLLLLENSLYPNRISKMLICLNWNILQVHVIRNILKNDLQDSNEANINLNVKNITACQSRRGGEDMVGSAPPCRLTTLLPHTQTLHKCQDKMDGLMYSSALCRV